MSKRLEDTWPASKVTLWAIDKIKPYEKNPRLHSEAQISLIASSMKDDGVTAPILVDEAGVIIYGHGRRLAALRCGFTQYPVAVALGWSETKKQAVRLKDNSYATLSTWDAALIQGELKSLKLSGYDMPLIGFPEAQLRVWVAAGSDSEEVPEVVPDPPKKPVVRKGDLWLLGDHRILCGDATSESDVAKVLGDGRPNLMVTDPPYGVNYDPNWRNEPEKLNLKSTTAFAKKTKAIGKVVNDDRADWTEAWRHFSGDVAYVWCGERQSVGMAGQLETFGLMIRNLIVVWAKTHHVISRGHYHPQHETCWYVVRAGKTGHWAGDRAQSTLWTISNLRQFGRDDGNPETGHGTQKPIECMKRPIENNSQAGDFVYEPFSGSGTTIIACEMTGRKCLAIEIAPEYVEVGILRWQAFTGKLATLDGRTLEEVRKARRVGRAKAGAPNEKGAPTGAPLAKPKRAGRAAAQAAR